MSNIALLLPNIEFRLDLLIPTSSSDDAAKVKKVNAHVIFSEDVTAQDIEDKFALCEDGRGQSLVMRVGDKVMNGVVEALRRDAVVVRITADGQTQSVAIPLTRKGDKSNATR